MSDFNKDFYCPECDALIGIVYEFCSQCGCDLVVNDLVVNDFAGDYMEDTDGTND